MDLALFPALTRKSETRKQRTSEKTQAFIQRIWAAWQEWQAAKSFFENATDPDLVECAVYNLEAKRRHFAYLLRIARDELDKEAQAQLVAGGMTIYEF